MRHLYARQTGIPIDLVQCGSLGFLVPVVTPPTTPPYFLIVYDDLNSIPTVYPLTVKSQYASWTVVYPAGTTIVYSLVDSEGKSLSKPSAAKIRAGESACLPPPSNPTRLAMTSDVLNDLSTCSPLNIRIDGGQKPYTVSLVPIDVAPVINITLGVNHDSLYWVNVLLPSTALLVAASDSQGLYGYFHRYVTSGTNSATGCSDQVTGTHSFNSRDTFGQKSNTTINTTGIAATPTGGSSPNITNITANGNNANSHNDGGRTAGIVGGTMGAIILLGLLFILYRHRKRHRRGHERVAELVPDPTPFDYSTPGGSMNQMGVPSTSFGHYHNLQSTSSPGYAGVAGTGVNGTSRKVARASQEQDVPAPPPIDHGAGVQVRQHTDAMGVIELPPAYRDASLE